jgi:hypothetical protein
VRADLLKPESLNQNDWNRCPIPTHLRQYGRAAFDVPLRNTHDASPVPSASRPRDPAPETETHHSLLAHSHSACLLALPADGLCVSVSSVLGHRLAYQG